MLVNVHYKLSGAARNATFVATGEKPEEKQQVDFDMAHATPEQRKLLTEWNDISSTRLEILILKDYTAAGANLAESNVYLDTAPTLDETFAIVARAIADKQRIAAEEDAKRRAQMAAADAARIAQNAAWEATEARKRAATEAEIAERIKRESAKAAWVEAHGSDQLRRACARGHDCQRLYVVERAGIEAPGYVVDFQAAAQWKDRSCPSVRSLDEADAAEAMGLDASEVRIVWLTHPAAWRKDEVDPYEYDPREAVVIRGYLGKYDLVRVMDRQD